MWGGDAAHVWLESPNPFLRGARPLDVLLTEGPATLLEVLVGRDRLAAPEDSMKPFPFDRSAGLADLPSGGDATVAAMARWPGCIAQVDRSGVGDGLPHRPRFSHVHSARCSIAVVCDVGD